MNSGVSGIADDAEAMRKAFETFMLAGKMPTSDVKNDDDSQPVTTKRNKKKKKHSLGRSPPKPSSTSQKLSDGCDDAKSPSLLIAMQSSRASTDKKRYYQLLRSFNDKVLHTWFDMDDQIVPLLQNIVSIRSRLPLEWKLLHSSSRDLQGGWGDIDGSDRDDSWKYCGFLGRANESSYSFHLHAKDIQLALTNDLTQHEKMLAGLRTLMSKIADCHDGLGRVVDTLWKFHCSECAANEDRIEDNEGFGRELVRDDVNVSMENIVQVVMDVLHILSMELYRKQGLVLLVIESAGGDGILGIESNKGKLKSIGSGEARSLPNLQAAQKCCKAWPRSSKESFVEKILITRLFDLGGEITQHNNSN